MSYTVHRVIMTPLTQKRLTLKTAQIAIDILD